MKNTWKKIISAALALVMLMSLAACGGNGGDEQTDAGKDEQGGQRTKQQRKHRFVDEVGARAKHTGKPGHPRRQILKAE